jgi:CHAD domain-containing protein
LPPLGCRKARRSLRRFVQRALERGHHLPRNDYARLHALRRSARRVRFALEWLGEPSDELIMVQDTLGAFGDAWVAFRRARHARTDGETRKHCRHLERVLRTTARDARRAWKHARPALEEIV